MWICPLHACTRPTPATPASTAWPDEGSDIEEGVRNMEYGIRSTEQARQPAGTTLYSTLRGRQELVPMPCGHVWSGNKQRGYNNRRAIQNNKRSTSTRHFVQGPTQVKEKPITYHRRGAPKLIRKHMSYYIFLRAHFTPRDKKNQQPCRRTLQTSNKHPPRPPRRTRPGPGPCRRPASS